jgi:hydroxyacylglutathione hydrolase
MSNFIQKTISVGRLQCNCQILVCPQTLDTVLVDPGDDAHLILDQLKKIETELGKPLQVRALLHTHAHFDHCGATRKVKEAFLKGGETVPQIYLHPKDEFLYNILPQQSAMFGFVNDEPLPVDHRLSDNEELQFGSLKFSVLHTPGHSPGGICLRLHENNAVKIPETVFTGDTLFRESVGRSDLWEGDQNILLKSIQQRLLVLDDDTRAWPGHGMPTSIGHERKKNPYL